MNRYELEKGIKTVVYARVSTDDEKQLNSFEAQAEYYQMFCRENGFDYLKTYSDRGSSGTNVGRPEFTQMLSDAGIEATKTEQGKYYNFDDNKKKPKFNLIVVKDVARFSRNVADTLNLVKRLREKAVYVLFETQGICTKSADSDMMLSVFSTLAEAESQANSKRQKFAMMYRIKNKIYTGNALPYGYERDENNHIVIDQEKAEIVRFIFERGKHIGSRMVARELNDKGVKTETGIAWGASQVHQILEKKAYYGNPEINKYTTLQINSIAKRLTKEDEVEIEGALPAIITKELFDEVREAIEARTSTSGYGQRQPKTEDVFHLKVKCGVCGGMYTRKRTLRKNKNGTTKEYYSYYCLNKNKKSICTNKRTVADNLLKKLVVTETPVIYVKLGFGDTYSKIVRAVEQMKKRHDSVIIKLQAQSDELEIELKELDKSYIREKVKAMRERIAKMVEDLTLQKDEIAKKINNLTFENLDYYLQEASKRKKQIEESSKSVLTDDDKITLVKQIYVNDDDTFDFSYLSPNYNDIIEELNELLDDDLIISSRDTIEDRQNTHKYIYENKQFINAKDYYQYSDEEYEEIQHQMNEMAREKAELN